MTDRKYFQQQHQQVTDWQYVEWQQQVTDWQYLDWQQQVTDWKYVERQEKVADWKYVEWQEQNLVHPDLKYRFHPRLGRQNVD